MNTRFSRFLSLFLAALMLLGSSAMLLVSCDNGTSDDTTAPDSTTAEATEAETTAPETPAEYTLVKGGEPVARIIRHEDLDITSTDVTVAKAVYKQISATTGVDLAFGSDWVAPGKSLDSSSVEILIGRTDYPETAQVLSTLAYGDYAVAAVGNKIVLASFSNEGMNRALAAFKGLISAAGTKGDLVLTADQINTTGTVIDRASLLPRYQGGGKVEYYATGNNTDEVIIRDTSMAEFDAYLELLQAQKYELYSTRTLTGNKFAILSDPQYTLNVGYYDYEKSTRIIIEETKNATFPAPESENKFTPVTTSQITMIGLEYLDNSNSYVGNGMSFLIRLTDGRFIVIDGGFNRQQHADLIVQQIQKQSAAYSAQTGTVIAAWIITHAHGDHQGMIANKYTTLISRKVTVQNFIVNFMSDSERELAISSSRFGGNWSSSEGSGYSSVLNAAKGLKANVIVAHPGHEYFFADLHMEVLYTIDSYGPEVANALNTTSLVIKMTFTDPKTGKQTVYMSTGDATGAGFGICAAMYGDYLKSDIVQVAHHGSTTWGNSDRTIAAYLLMAPSTLLWPRGLDSIASSLKSSWNTPLFDKRNANWRETYVAGREGTITTLPRPYTVGSASTAPYSKK